MEDFFLEGLSSFPPKITLFIISFLASTIVPMGSEPYFLFLQKTLDSSSVSSLIIVATIGNTLGSYTTFCIGRLGRFNYEKLKPYIPRIQKYGPWLALLSPLPILGDAFVVGLGYFRCSPILCLILVAIAKFIRYFAVSKAFEYFI